MTATEIEIEVNWTADDTEALRALVADEDSRQWQIGDMLLDHMPMGQVGVATGIGAKLREVAAEVGAEPAALAQYRKLSHAWPKGTRVPFATYEAHRAYMGSPDSAADRAQTLASLPRNEHGYVTKKAVRDLTKGASGAPSWNELIGSVGDTLIKVEKLLTKTENAIGDREVDERIQEKAERYAGWADDLANRLRNLAA